MAKYQYDGGSPRDAVKPAKPKPAVKTEKKPTKFQVFNKEVSQYARRTGKVKEGKMPTPAAPPKPKPRAKGSAASYAKKTAFYRSQSGQT